jgi:hypothetical protein
VQESGPGVPAHPPRRRRRSIWPISDHARGNGLCNSRHTSPEPEAEGEDSPSLVRTLRVDADVTVTLNHLFGVARERTPPENANPKDAAIQSAGGRQWVRRRASLRGRPVVVTPTKAPLAYLSPHRWFWVSIRSAVGARVSTIRSAAARRLSRSGSSCRRGASPSSPPGVGAPPPRSPSCPRPSV